MANVVYADPFGSYVRGQEAGQQQAIGLATAQRAFRDSDREAEFRKWYDPHMKEQLLMQQQQAQLAADANNLKMKITFAMMGGDEKAQQEVIDYISQMTGGNVKLDFKNLTPAQRTWFLAVARGDINPVMAFNGIQAAGNVSKPINYMLGYPPGYGAGTDQTNVPGLFRGVNYPEAQAQPEAQPEGRVGQPVSQQPTPQANAAPSSGIFVGPNGERAPGTIAAPAAAAPAPQLAAPIPAPQPAGAVITPPGGGVVAGGAPPQESTSNVYNPATGVVVKPKSLGNYNPATGEFIPDANTPNPTNTFGFYGSGGFETPAEVQYGTPVNVPPKQYGTPKVTVGQPVTVPRSVTPPWVPTKTSDAFPYSENGTERVRGTARRMENY